MDISYVLIWMVGAGLVTLFLRSIQHPFTNGRSWQLICPAIAAVMILTWKLEPRLTGAVGACLYAVLVVAPSLLCPWVARLTLQKVFSRAKILAELARFLHPTDGVWDLPKLVQTFEHWAKGEEEAALKTWKLLHHERLVKNPFVRALVLQNASNALEWENVVRWTNPELFPDGWLDPHLPMYRARALGELGRLNEQLGFYELFLLGHRPYPSTAPTVAMFVAAFHGRIDIVEELLNTSLAKFPVDIKTYWRATALWFQGQVEAASQLLEELGRSLDPGIRRGAARRAQSSREPLPLDPATHLKLNDLNLALKGYLQQSSVPVRRLGTFLLMALLFAVYLVEEQLGGSTSLDVLLRMGAAHPVLIKLGEYWRLFTAGFLHYGGVHLAMNLLGFFFLGPVVESLLGTVKYLLLFLICIVASVIGVTALELAGWMEPQVMIGASGGVMGMVGWLAAYFLREWLRYRTPINRTRVQALAVALIIQVAFDLSTENVSFAGHLGGMIAGFTLGIVHRRKKI